MKKLSVVLFAALAFLSGSAAQISESQALAVASKYIKAEAGRKLQRVQGNSRATAAPYYVFNSGDGEGFVIVSGDDEMTELVGYSATGRFDSSNVPQNMQSWLDGYARYVEQVQSGELTGYKQALKAGTPVVSPLVKTQWNQDAPFNNLCPADRRYEGRPTSYSGCVATAMAQVMNYWQWPVQGKGTNSYYSEAAGKTLFVNFTKSTYDWANMRENYNGHYTTTEGEAVARLMYDCGVAVLMNYSYEGSGAQDTEVPVALAEHFGYKSQVYYRNAYSTSGFLALIKNELDNERPVLFSGQGTAGGHEYVVDGYDNNNFLHVNWGWGGLSDGYYDMALMNPDALGAGGGAGGFTDMQSIATMEKDPTMEGDAGQKVLMLAPRLLNIGTVGTIKTDKSSYKKGEQMQLHAVAIWNSGNNNYYGELAIGLYDENFERVAISQSAQFSLSAFNIISSSSMFTMQDELKNLPDGQYMIWALSKETATGKTFDWLRVASEEYVLLTVSGDNLVIGTGDVDVAVDSEVKMSKEEVFPGDKVSFSFSVKNNGVVPVSGTLVCEISDVESGRTVMRKNLDVSLSESASTPVAADVTLSKSVFKADKTYRFSVASIKVGDETFAVSGSVPFEFTVSNPSGVDELDSSAAVSVYPNPTVAEVHIACDSPIESVAVYSLDGRLVKRVPASATVDLSDCPGGVYLLKVVSSNGPASLHRVMKQ